MEDWSWITLVDESSLRQKKMPRVIRLIATAPVKPAPGQPCNGCGVCCAAETCPAGRLIFRRRAGPCPALAWDEAGGRYRCRLVTRPGAHLGWLPAAWSGAAARIFARWIAAGQGCDSDAEVGDGEPE